MLDSRKMGRMIATRALVRQGRTRTVTLVYARPEGTAYVSADVVWRPLPYAEPAATESGVRSAAGVAAVRAEFPPELDPRLVSLVADTATATAAGVAAAPHYEVLTYQAAGIFMNRWMVELKRLR